MHPGNETYRTIFITYFNIPFGYSGTDTCTTCDEYLAKMKCLEHENEKLDQTKKEDITAKIKQLTTSHDLHLCKAKSFYSIKKQSKLSSRKSNVTESICIDFGKHFPIPKITTNNVYYKRQLSNYLFNVHVLSDSRSVFYVYQETIAKKGSDSCGGQNKNYTFFRYLYYLVHQQKRFDCVRVTFPIKGHSYMENDKNMGIIARVETVKELCDLVQCSRKNLRPL
ncbi:unnamed protein product [Psylliodes chrysocephalus]|uniref:Uncharacterized protein n=1 Tax=Psylliodes chrysocephalus TaxID=3402493 RepID=A0A9P0CXU4_9CUCU|nr:unnamed protein product [Psylliodes chrysocephala]